MQKGTDTVIVRLPRVFGPSMQMSDSKAVAQFIKHALKQEDIILKSMGNQLYSYSYIADAVSGILYCLIRGKNREAYNIAGEDSNMILKEMSERIAVYAGVNVRSESPDILEKAGHSLADKAILSGKKVSNRGWVQYYGLAAALSRTLNI